MKSRKVQKQNIIIILNIVLPIFLGGILYYLMSPEVIFVKALNDFFEVDFYVLSINKKSIGFRFIRNYFLDMLWGYSLVFALFWTNGNNTADIKKVFLIAFVFSAIIEISQITYAVKGSFDIYDIVVEFFAEVFAVFIINFYIIRRKSK